MEDGGRYSKLIIDIDKPREGKRRMTSLGGHVGDLIRGAEIDSNRGCGLVLMSFGGATPAAVVAQGDKSLLHYYIHFP